MLKEEYKYSKISDAYMRKESQLSLGINLYRVTITELAVWINGATMHSFIMRNQSYVYCKRVVRRGMCFPNLY